MCVINTQTVCFCLTKRVSFIYLFVSVLFNFAFEVFDGHHLSNLFLKYSPVDLEVCAIFFCLSLKLPPSLLPSFSLFLPFFFFVSFLPSWDFYYLIKTQ